MGSVYHPLSARLLERWWRVVLWARDVAYHVAEALSAYQLDLAIELGFEENEVLDDAAD